MTQTAEEKREIHIQRHKELHAMLDELSADYIRHNLTYENKKTLKDVTLMDLMTWSHEQTKNPTGD